MLPGCFVFDTVFDLVFDDWPVQMFYLFLVNTGSPSKSQFTSNHVRGLKLISALLQLPGALTSHVRGSRVMGPQGLPGCPTGDLPQLLHAPHDGPVPGTGGPSTAELLDVTGQMPISQLLSRHRVRWLGHAARKPETTIVNQLLHADSIPGRPRPVGRPHYAWKDGTMQDLSALGPRLQLNLLRDWPKLALDRELWRGFTSRC